MYVPSMTSFETSLGDVRECQSDARRPESDECPAWRTCSHLRSITDPDGGLVLDLKTGRFHSLNRTSAIVWKTLRDNPRGADSGEILQAMTAAFGPDPRITGDLDGLLRTFEDKGLIQRYPIDDWSPGLLPVTPEIREEPTEKDGALANAMLFELPPPPESTQARRRAWWTSAAWFGFLVVYLILSIGGFPRLYQMLRWLSARRRQVGIASKEKVETVCAAVNRAATLYLRRSRCLQRAAVTFLLLRLAGVPAEFVIGCRRLPFFAHAWVEINRVVINDNVRVKSVCRELDRL
jgi:hypothetical protein